MPGAGPAAPGARMVRRSVGPSPVVEETLDLETGRPPLPADVGAATQIVAVRGISERDGECHAQDDEQDAGPAKFVRVGLAHTQVDRRATVAGGRWAVEG